MAVKLSLNWRDFETNMRLTFETLREDHNFCDVTLVCEEGQVEAHRLERNERAVFHICDCKLSPTSKY